MSAIVLSVPGMSCDHCRAAVEREVGAVRGVSRVAVDLEAKRVAVDGHAAEDELVAAIAEAGYEVAGRV
jgi:copper ion binding protein